MGDKRVITKTPVDLGLEAIDLTATGTTTSNLIRMGRGHAVKLIFIGTPAGTDPAQGEMSVDIDVYRKTNDGTEYLHTVVDITGTVDLTGVGVGATAGAIEDVLLFGGGILSTYRGEGTLSGDADLLQIVDWFKVKITVDTVSDAGTSHVLDVYAQVQE